MKVILVFPPQWTPFRPYLSLPSLAAYLRQKGIEVIQKDFNVEAYDTLLSSGYLKSLEDRLRSRFALLDSKTDLAPGFEQKYYSDLFMAVSVIGHISSEIEKAKEVFRNKRLYYDPEKLSQAIRIMNQALAI